MQNCFLLPRINRIAILYSKITACGKLRCISSGFTNGDLNSYIYVLQGIAAQSPVSGSLF